MRIKSKKEINRGFTLIELMIVIGIIALLSATVMIFVVVAKNKANKNSALSTAQSVMTELMACETDGGFATNAVISPENTPVCCTTSACTAFFPGHNIKWPALGTNRWEYESAAPTGTLSNRSYVYRLTDGNNFITCSMSTQSCN